MRKTNRGAVILALAAFLPCIGVAQEIPPEQAEAIVREIQESHIIGNVPSEADFRRLLLRDLSAYFATEAEPNPRVEYELLRHGPTQTGIAYPKFYVWVRVEGAVNRQGAARLAAIKRERFEVTHFIEKSDIARDPSRLDALFPPPVAEAIKTKLDPGGS